MKKIYLKLVYISLFSCIFFSNTFSLDVTDKIENLGNPFIEIYNSGEKIYARNIWTLKAYQGAIFIGGGNSSNEGPAQNSGPVPVFKYDPIKGKFIKEFLVSDEQIDSYYVFDNVLFIPGHDPREDWSFGNLYQRDSKGAWKKYRNIPNALHNYSMTYFNKLLFCGIKQTKGCAVAVSDDFGKSWKVTNLNYPRIFSFFNLNDKLYIVTEAKVNAKNPVFEFTSESQFYHRRDIFNETLFPGTALNKKFGNKMIKPITFNNILIYVGAHSHNDHQSIPFGVFVAKSFVKNNISVEKVQLPKGEVPWDIKKADGKIYLLTGKKGTNRTKISVFQIDKNLMTIKKLFHFYSSTFARSFEILNNDFYFGLGCEVKNTKYWRENELVPETGQILRVAGTALNEPLE